MKRGRQILLAAAVAGISLVGEGLQAQKGERCFGHVIPPFKEVFIKILRVGQQQMSVGQLEKIASALSAQERSAIADYLGEEGAKQVNQGLPAEKQKHFAKWYPRSGEAMSDSQFKPLYPNIISVINNESTVDQVKTVVSNLTAEDLASQSFFLGEDGRRTLFSKISTEKIQVILEHTEDWVLIETGKRKYKTIAQYTCIFYKQERVGGKWQDREKILLKFREKPLAMYLKWLDGPYTGREVLYNEAVFGPTKVRVRESGLLGVIPVTIPLDSELAKRGTNHLVTEIGLKYLLFMIERDYVKAMPKGDLKRVNHGIVTLDKIKVFKTESILPRDPKLGYYCHRIIHYIDYLASLEIQAEIFNHQNLIQEIYYYTNIKINPGLTDNDFDPNNPKYGLK